VIEHSAGIGFASELRDLSPVKTTIDNHHENGLGISRHLQVVHVMLRRGLIRATHAHPTSPRSTGLCAIWDCISSSSSSPLGQGAPPRRAAKGRCSCCIPRWPLRGGNKNEHRGSLRGTLGSACPQPEPNATELPVAPPSQRAASCAKTATWLRLVAYSRARAARAPQAKSCATSCGTSSATPSVTPGAASFTCWRRRRRRSWWWWWWWW